MGLRFRAKALQPIDLPPADPRNSDIRPSSRSDYAAYGKAQERSGNANKVVADKPANVPANRIEPTTNEKNTATIRVSFTPVSRRSRGITSIISVCDASNSNDRAATKSTKKQQGTKSP